MSVASAPAPAPLTATMFEDNISLYIPHVFTNFDQAYIAHKFEHIGIISRVDLVGKQDRKGKYYNAAYIHFVKWHNNETARIFYKNVTNKDGQARMYHDGPWYWIVLPNNAKKHIPGERKETINLTGSSISSSYIVEPPQDESTVADEQLVDEEFKALDDEEFKALDEEDLDEDLDEAFKVFDEEVEAAQMEEIEKIMAEDDKHLITIDGRYVHSLEEENNILRNNVCGYEIERQCLLTEINQLRDALINMEKLYKVELAKVTAFTSGI